jgi:ferrous iron transport protein B
MKGNTMRVALIGNPNCGKTTLFNALTGSHEQVGNWPGVTVSRKEGNIKSNLLSTEDRVRLIDLPGTYSMSPFSNEERITLDFITRENPDVIINIVDATALKRSLFLTTQLRELNVPMVIALNKWDQCITHHIDIDVKLLSKRLGCPVVKVAAIKAMGLKALMREVITVKATRVKVDQAKGLFSDIDPSKWEERQKARYGEVDVLLDQIEHRAIDSSNQTLHDRLDRVLAHRVWGIVIFALVLYGVFSISQTYVGPFFADLLVSWIDAFYVAVQGLMGEGISPFLQALLLDGLIGGVGAVVGFLPLIAIMFFMLALLEDSGYMARVALLMDPYMKRVGLSGRSIIPMVISTGCAIPGIMATRTIRDERQRRTTAMLTVLMPCGAKLPVIALFAGVFFQNQPWIGPMIYLLSIVLIFVSALLIQRLNGSQAMKSYFIMELPTYRWPSLKRAWHAMVNQSKAFIQKAMTIILVSNAAVMIMQSFTINLQLVEEGAEATSILAQLASPLSVLLLPLGFGVWQLAAAAVTGFIAKENVVGTLAVVFSISNFIDPEALELISGSGEVASVMGIGSVAALAYLMFNLYTPPCFAAIGAMNAEMQSRKWVIGAVAFQLGLGYSVAYLVYQIGTLITTGSFGVAWFGGLLALIAMAGVLNFIMYKQNKKAVAETEVAHG